MFHDGYGGFPRADSALTSLLVDHERYRRDADLAMRAALDFMLALQQDKDWTSEDEDELITQLSAAIGDLDG